MLHDRWARLLLHHRDGEPTRTLLRKREAQRAIPTDDDVVCCVQAHETVTVVQCRMIARSSNLCIQLSALSTIV